MTIALVRSSTRTLYRHRHDADHTIFISQTIRVTLHDSWAWTKSDALRQAHKTAGKRTYLYVVGRVSGASRSFSASSDPLLPDQLIVLEYAGSDGAIRVGHVPCPSLNPSFHSPSCVMPSAHL